MSRNSWAARGIETSYESVRRWVLAPIRPSALHRPQFIFLLHALEKGDEAPNFGGCRRAEALPGRDTRGQLWIGRSKSLSLSCAAIPTFCYAPALFKPSNQSREP